MKIIVDAMGGDNAPLEIVRGALAANRDHGVEIILVGRTAEVLKAVEACGEKSLPAGVEIKDAAEVVEIARSFYEDGFHIMATGTTYDLIHEAGIPAEKVKKLYEGRPNIMDLITNGKIQLIVNSPSGKESVHDDSYLRKAAIKSKIPYMTTIAAARVAAKGIRYMKEHGMGDVMSLQDIHREIHDKE